MKKPIHIFIPLCLIAFFSSCAPVSTSTSSTETPTPLVTLAAQIELSSTLSPALVATPYIISTPIRDVSAVFLPGVFLGPFNDTELHPETVKRTLTAIKEQLGATSITIVVQWFQKDVTSTELLPMYDRFPASLSDEKLTYLIQTAHEMGFTVLLCPLVGVETFWDARPHPFGQGWHHIIPTDAWWDSYSTFITYYAAFAQDNHVDMYYVHSELLGTIRYSTQWEKIIKYVRQLYNGPIGAAINSGSIDEYYPWLEKLDFIGTGFMNEFHTNDKNMTVTEMISEIESYPHGDVKNLAYVESLHTKYNKPIIFYETGIPSFTGAAGIPNALDIMDIGGVSPNLQEQADYFESLFRSFYTKSWVSGIMVGDWFMLDSGGCQRLQNWPISQSVVDKPAATVVRSWFSQPNRYSASPNPLTNDGHVDIGYNSLSELEGKLDYPCHNIPPIVIDGRLDDWDGISPLIVDPIGDNNIIETQDGPINIEEAKGSHMATDLKALYTYRTSEYLVVAIEGATGLNREPNYMLFLDIDGDKVTDVQVFVMPPYDIIDYEYYGDNMSLSPAGYGRYSAFENVLELAIPLEYFGYPESISISNISNCYCNLEKRERHDIIGDPAIWYPIP